MTGDFWLGVLFGAWGILLVLNLGSDFYLGGRKKGDSR